MSAPTFSAYLTTDDADTLSASCVPALQYWPAATADQKAAALVLATIAIDRGMRYQGRKYDPSQALEFPRVAYESFTNYDPYPCPVPNANALTDIWDWDADNQVAVVPGFVQLACIYQADYELSGKRDALLERVQEGLTASKVGSLAENYDLELLNSLAAESLCRRSLALLDRYKIRQGRFL